MKNKDVITLSTIDHIRIRHGLYVGKLGDGTDADDGGYVLLKEVLYSLCSKGVKDSNSSIQIDCDGQKICIRSYCPGFDFSIYENFLKESQTRICKVNFDKDGSLFYLVVASALSSTMTVELYRNGNLKRIQTSCGRITVTKKYAATGNEDELFLSFLLDKAIFSDFTYDPEIIRDILYSLAVCHPGVRLFLNDELFFASEGMLDLLKHKNNSADISHAVHITDKLCDLAIAPVVGNSQGSIISFANGRPTRKGSHIDGLTDGLYKILKKFAPYPLLKSEIPSRFTIAFNIHVEDFEWGDCSKWTLANRRMSDDGEKIKDYLYKLLDKHLSRFLTDNCVTRQIYVKSIKMPESLTLHQLLNSVKENDLLASLHRLYPRMFSTGILDNMMFSFRSLKALSPQESDGELIVIDYNDRLWHEQGIAAWFNIDKGWRALLAREIKLADDLPILSAEDIAVLCLWRIASFGLSEEELEWRQSYVFGDDNHKYYDRFLSKCFKRGCVYFPCLTGRNLRGRQKERRHIRHLKKLYRMSKLEETCDYIDRYQIKTVGHDEIWALRKYQDVYFFDLPNFDCIGDFKQITRIYRLFIWDSIIIKCQDLEYSKGYGIIVLISSAPQLKELSQAIAHFIQATYPNARICFGQCPTSKIAIRLIAYK